MKKIYCDATSKEIINGNYKILDIPIHIIELYENGISSYADSDGNAVGGKITKLELNQESYNKIMFAAYKEFRRIQEENNIDISEEIKKIQRDFMPFKMPIKTNDPLRTPTVVTMYGIEPYKGTAIYGVNIPNVTWNKNDGK